MLYLEMDDEYNETETLYAENGASVRISNPDAENGLIEDLTPPLSWLNSARITADPDDDAVYLNVSVGDPRGGFSFAVRRLSDGRIVIHTPHPDESLAHMKTKESHPGTLEVVCHSGDPYHAINDPEYFLTFETDNTVDIYDNKADIIDDRGISLSFIAGYIPLETHDEQEAEIQAKLYQCYIDKWKAGEIDVDDIPDIEY